MVQVQYGSFYPNGQSPDLMPEPQIYNIKKKHKKNMSYEQRFKLATFLHESQQEAPSF